MSGETETTGGTGTADPTTPTQTGRASSSGGEAETDDDTSTSGALPTSSGTETGTGSATETGGMLEPLCVPEDEAFTAAFSFDLGEVPVEDEFSYAFDELPCTVDAVAVQEAEVLTDLTCDVEGTGYAVFVTARIGEGNQATWQAEDAVLLSVAYAYDGRSESGIGGTWLRLSDAQGNLLIVGIDSALETGGPDAWEHLPPLAVQEQDEVCGYEGPASEPTTFALDFTLGEGSLSLGQAQAGSLTDGDATYRIEVGLAEIGNSSHYLKRRRFVVVAL